MRTVWKFHLHSDDVQEIDMPKGAEILTVQGQQGEPQIWVLVDPEQPKVKHKVLVCGTGHDRQDLEGARYVGTFQIYSGALVFHVFDGGEVGE